MTREEAIDFLECRRAYYASLSTDPNPNVKATKVCGYTLSESANACLMAIEALEQTRKGHWINAKVGKLFSSNDFKCSECDNLLDFDGVNCGRGNANFCPNCGAKMENET